MGRVYISAPRTEGLFVYQWSVPDKKQSWWLMKCLFKYSTEIRFVLEILGNSKVIASELPWKCVNPPNQNRRPLNYVAFLLVILVDSTPFLIYSRNSTCYSIHQESIPCLQTYSLGFFLKYLVWFGRMFGHRTVVDENCTWQQNF